MSASESVPRIGVSWTTVGQKKSDRYLNAVTLGGGDPLVLPVEAHSWASELKIIRGLVLTGGGDVDPALYHEQNNRSAGVKRQRDELEQEALRHCLDRGLPVLAICRGLQLVNVALGGSLIQDIQSEIEHRADGEESRFHEVEVRPDTRLAAIAGTASTIRVNSRHHQGVDVARLAPRARISALAPDCVVEGFELEDYPFLVAVQCHPEYLDQVPKLSRLFDELALQALKM